MTGYPLDRHDQDRFQANRRAAGGAAAGASIFLVNLFWFRPFSLDHFYEKIFISFVLEQPELLTRLGIAEQFGYRKHNAHLDDAVDGEGRARFRGVASAPRRPRRPTTSQRRRRQQRLSTRVLTWFIESQLEGEKFRFHDYPVNQLFGVQSRRRSS